MNTSESLRLSLKKTLAYFDLANFPLTKEELYSYLWEPPAVNYPDFLLSLRDYTFGGGEAIPQDGSANNGIAVSSQKIGTPRNDTVKPFAMTEKNGYYFFSGREELIETRRHRLLISEHKLKIACRAARLVRSVPFLKAIFVCNTVGSEQATKDSDIDFFIVTEKNRIWITRLGVTFLLGLFRLRRVGDRIKDKICLSFYVTADNLNLANLRVIDDDIHFAYWINQMLPIFDPENLYAKFLQANSWTKKYLPNVKAEKIGSYIFHITESKLGKAWKGAWEKMWQGAYGDLINGEAKKIQISKMRFSGKKIDRGEDKGVVISDQVLKFHEKDTRLEYRQTWLDKIAVIPSEPSRAMSLPAGQAGDLSEKKFC